MGNGMKAPRLFTVRMWQEEAADGAPGWRGKVQALPEGEAYYFRDWATLVSQLQTMLDTASTALPAPSQTEGGRE